MRKLSLIAALTFTSLSCDPAKLPPAKPELTATPTPVQFGQVAVDETATKTVSVNNIGTAAVTVSSSVGAGSLFTVPANVTIAAGASTQVSVRFRPNRVALMSEEWILAVPGEAPLLRVPLRGEGVTPCNDADSDGALANCPTATDCDDTLAAVHPGAVETCNGGRDDDCDPLTVEVCDAGVDGGADAGRDAGVDAGPPDAGPCTCVDDPNDCRGVNACVRDAGAPVCTTFDLPNTTSCVRSGADGGAGVCQNASCVECITATDCIALNPNATVCDLLTCNAGRCESQRRHDNTAWRVSPPLSSELLLNGSATTLKAMWDGQNFAVAMITLDGGAVLRRVSRAGTIVDPLGFRLSPRVKDIAYSGDRFLQVTEEPAGGAQPFNFIAGSYFSYDGGANSASQPLISDVASAAHPVPHFAAPSVAGSSLGSFMVIAGASQYPWVKWRQLPGGSGEITTPMLPRFPVLTGSPNGYSLATQDSSIGLGDAEAGGAFYGRTTGDTGYAVRVPYIPADLIRGAECCTQASRLATNGSTFIMAYTWGGVAALYRIYDVALQPTGPPTQYPLGGATFTPGQTIELGNDGVNFLIVQAPSATTLRVIRVTPAGDQLDTPTFDVSNPDSIIESQPRLASDGQGRNLLAYQKIEGAQTNTYVRLFTTCP